MKKRALTLLLTAALSAGLLAGCGSSSDSSTAASDTQETTDSESSDTAEATSDSKGSLRVLTYNNVVGHIDSVLAYAAGYYEDEGLDIQMTYNNSG